MYKKKCTAPACKLAFLLIRPIVVFFFTVLQRCLRHLALHDFILCLKKVEILLRASLLALAKSVYCIKIGIRIRIRKLAAWLSGQHTRLTKQSVIYPR